MNNPGEKSGRWTNLEHFLFLAGIKHFGRNWKKVSKLVQTRTAAQVRSHAQKFETKMEKTSKPLHKPLKLDKSTQYEESLITPAIFTNIADSSN